MVNITAGVSGSFISSVSTGFDFSVSNCIFKCSTTFPVATVTSELSTSTTNYGSLFQFTSANSIISTSNTFYNCWVTSVGAIFDLTSSPFTETGSTYLDNSALKGGAIMCTSCTATITNA